MWVTVLHVLEWPGAIFCGFAIGRVARGLGLPVWLAYGAALAVGAAITLAGAALAGSQAQLWHGYPIWAAWAAFGIVQGRGNVRRSGTITTLNLSGKPR